MVKKVASLITGLILIALGILFLLHNMDIIWLEGEWVGASILFMLGLSFLFYIFQDRKLWWPLIPSLILFTLSAIVLLSYYFDVDGKVLGSLFLWGTGVAFLAVYLKQRSNIWSLLVSWLFIVLGFVVLAEHIFWRTSGLGGSVFFAGCALGFLGFYLKKKEQWWSLFVSLLLFTLAAVVAVAVTDYLPDAMAGSVFLWGAGLSFISIFLQKRDYWWAIIPGGSMLVLGLFPMMVTYDWGWDGLIAFIFFFGIGLVFTSLYLVKIEGKRLYWAKMPAIILVGFSLFLLLVTSESSAIRALFSLFLMALGVYLVIRYALKREPA